MGNKTVSANKFPKHQKKLTIFFWEPTSYYFTTSLTINLLYIFLVKLIYSYFQIEIFKIQQNVIIIIEQFTKLMKFNGDVLTPKTMFQVPPSFYVNSYETSFHPFLQF